MHDIWNPWHGCKKCSEGCQNCYMYDNDARRGKNGADIYRTKTGFCYPVSKNRSGQYKVKRGEMLREMQMTLFRYTPPVTVLFPTIKNRHSAARRVPFCHSPGIQCCLPDLDSDIPGGAFQCEVPAGHICGVPVDRCAVEREISGNIDISRIDRYAKIRKSAFGQKNCYLRVPGIDAEMKGKILFINGVYRKRSVDYTDPVLPVFFFKAYNRAFPIFGGLQNTFDIANTARGARSLPVCTIVPEGSPNENAQTVIGFSLGVSCACINLL